MNLVFVYGTLKKGLGNHALLSRHGAVYHGEHYTSNKFSLYRCNSNLPYAVKEIGSGIKGEVYKVSDKCLEDLDILEGHPNWYKREIISIPGIGDCWIYIVSKENIYGPIRCIGNGEY